jgi:hypothetical protein
VVSQSLYFIFIHHVPQELLENFVAKLQGGFLDNHKHMKNPVSDFLGSDFQASIFPSLQITLENPFCS